MSNMFRFFASFLDCKRIVIRPLVVFAFVCVVFALPLTAGANLTIVPTWDSSITSDPNAATITNTINMAIQYYATRFADPITVSIVFEESGSVSLSGSQWYYYPIYYSFSSPNFLTSLRGDAKTVNDTNALKHLAPISNGNPVTRDSSIFVKTANLRAIGITGYDSQLPGGVDGIVMLNTSIMNLARESIDPSKYDLLSSVEHEINEVLGLCSDLDFYQTGTKDPFPEDLFRYASSGNGTRSFTTNGDNAWFSLDGTNLLVQFNQDPGNDFGDWWTAGPVTPLVQDATGIPGVTPNMGVELIALDVIGYDLLPPPQPCIVNLTVSGSDVAVTATNGLVTGTYQLLSSTNPMLPFNQWSSVATNFLTNSGNFTFTASNVVNAQAAQQFYALQLQ